MNIEYDTPIEVSREKYFNIMNKLSGLVAGRQEGEKYFVKLWFMKYAHYLKAML